MSDVIDVVSPPAGPTPIDSPEEARRKLDAVARDVRELASAEGASAELLHVLPELGPVFSGFARYLASRADRVPAGLRSDLASVPDWIGPAPFEEVRAVVEGAWRKRIEDVCWAIDEAPVRVAFPTQIHRVWLTPSDAVLLACVPESFERCVERELALLPMLSGALSGPLGGPDRFDAIVEDYRSLLRRLLDLGVDVAASEALVADARRFPPLRPRRAHAGLSSARVGVWDEIAGVSPDVPGFDHHEAGPSVCRAWLRQALLGRAFPEELTADDLVVAGRRQVSVGGRLFAALPTDAQITIQGYLVATAAGDPDLAIKYLLRELEPTGSADLAGFQRRMRHAWSVDADAAGGSEMMAQLLYHWRIAVEHGFRPRPRLVSFYRGCLHAVSAATAHGAEPDVLRDTLEALQIRLMAYQLETLTGITTAATRTAREAGWRFLTALASGPVSPDRPGSGGVGLPLATAGALLMALTAIGVALPALAASGAAWAEPVGAAMFAALGTVTLGLIVLRRSGS
jgi:hypothetical protein